MWLIPAGVEERSEGNFEKLVLSFYHMDPWDGPMELRLSGLVAAEAKGTENLTRGLECCC